MAKNKTAETEQHVAEFVRAFATTDEKIKDSFELIKIMEGLSGYPPKMWGPSIIGFGSYHYKYASGHEGDAPLLGFSPRKAAFTLYATTGLPEHAYLLEDLGKVKLTKGCIYFKMLSDLKMENIEKLMVETLRFMKEKYDDQRIC